ncbi:MAG: phosphoenolpyruvate carboxykinase (ATP) [Acidimicrobiales bacterium]|jgi:phosphoenolpyruvate carboxykinase (ATP)|nr:phosphoenolpyruvate carboxykinase (ATP) [Acidimicrobiales bacterium]
MLDLSYLGITNTGTVFHNISTPALYEEAIRRREAMLSHLGPLVVRTGQYTGRSADDKFIVREPSSEDRIWWGKHNRPIEESAFDRLLVRLGAYLQGRDLFVQDVYAGADPDYRVKVRVITEHAWHSLFARNLLLQELDLDVVAQFAPDVHVIQAPDFHAIPEIDGTRSEAFILVHFARRLIIIGGTSYAGEIKKSVFTFMNFLLPPKGVLSMHASANQGPEGDTAIFFGLSGTGKTTLSADPDRALIGDDEHGWSDNGVFNFEGGCYAKVIRLSRTAEPEIYETTRRFGTVLENVAMDTRTRRLDLDDAVLTENTRAAYPISHLPNIVRGGQGGHPRSVVLLTADAFGVLPPLARLTPDQAMYWFVSGYTAKVAGTERGVTEPSATFSPLFGAPFMPLHPTEYAELFGERVRRHGSAVWLVNTGWSGGPYGVGERMSIAWSRAAVRAALDGSLDGAAFDDDPVFGFAIPRSCPGLPDEVLQPRRTWSDPAAYDVAAADLARRFAENFAQYADVASQAVRDAGPRVP